MILVVGCTHGIQPEEDQQFPDTVQEREQRGKFAVFICRIINDNKIQFVGEEWGLPHTSIAHAVAEAHDQIPWFNINTSLVELREMGIPDNYVGGDYSAEQKAQWNRQREKVMIRKLRDNQRTAKRLIVVCGFDHMLPLTESLRNECRFVQFMDYRTLPWYDGALLP
ncbi:MAG: hypothetical protein ACRD23_00460 [Terriglobales bacterium]